MKELGIGLIGCGRWGQRLARIVQGLERAHIAAVQDWSYSSARTVAGQLEVPAYRTYQELIDDADVDALLVVIPHSFHEEVTVAAARAGKHVFCEKPLAIDVAACYRMIEATEEYNVKLMCGQVTRLYPLYSRVAEIVHAGQLGQLSSVNLTNLVHINRVNWWAKFAMMGALLHSPGVHIIDFLLFLCGSARTVHAVQSPIRVQSGIDYQDSVYLLVEFEDGVIGGIQCSVSCLTPGNRGHVVGTLGTLGSLRFDPRESWLEFVTWEGAQERIEVGPADAETRMDIGIQTELQSFINWIHDGEDPVLSGWDGLRAVEIIDAAYRSIEQKRPVELPLPRP